MTHETTRTRPSGNGRRTHLRDVENAVRADVLRDPSPSGASHTVHTQRYIHSPTASSEEHEQSPKAHDRRVRHRRIGRFARREEEAATCTVRFIAPTHAIRGRERRQVMLHVLGTSFVEVHETPSVRTARVTSARFGAHDLLDLGPRRGRGSARRTTAETSGSAASVRPNVTWSVTERAQMGYNTRLECPHSPRGFFAVRV
ncbi:hypothetical protein DES52_1047 [Deinococcus yavapaiensis KR-236]|uniref:Uncharacterized protein n=1 Tax=Deinococcus yavapaiensis KR-236 TaxID=694435 RepID=A0A318S7B0_9DEIO|nr:hypothetical protein DES52_1047 [Deinococcus yavapaiensis KR-236]